MTAFVAFVKNYSIWLYLLCGVGILVGIKILADARRLARTTLFSLEQERAGEQTYRAIMLIVIFILAIGAVTAVTAVSPPTQEAAILRAATPTLPVVIFPTNTAIPSLTPTLVKPTETPFLTATPVTFTPTRVVVVAKPSAVPTPTGAIAGGIKAPELIAPWNGMVAQGEGRKNSDLTFKWKWDCTQCVLGPNDQYVITIWYTDVRTGQPAPPIGAGLQQSACVQGICSYTLGQILTGTPRDVYQQAKENTFQWNVQVKRGEQPASPPSETWKFLWQ